MAHLALPLGGLMSLEPIETALEQIGCSHKAFEMTMSLLGLVVLGELRLSNRGLVELKNGQAPQFVDLVADQS